jgi:hypothetical protein
MLIDRWSKPLLRPGRFIDQAPKTTKDLRAASGLLLEPKRTQAEAPGNQRPAGYGVFFVTSLWLGFPRGAVAANGEAVGETFFLFAFGFFFSRLLLFWPFATVSSYGLDDADSVMQPARDACLQELSSPSHPCRPYRHPAWPESQNPSSAFRQPSLQLSPGGQRRNSHPVRRPSRPWQGR